MPIARIVPPRRSGFTLVELLVAILLFDCALLAFAGDAALLVRASGLARRRQIGAAVAQSRIELLRARGCPAPGTGDASPTPGIHERWAVTAPSDSTRILFDSVQYESTSVRLTFTLTSALGC